MKAPAPAGRTEAFSDGVFAIAITILVLDIHVPTSVQAADAGGLLRALAALWPAYLSYLATFLTIGNLWLSHHALFERIRGVDRTIQWLNLALLLLVSFIYFPTAAVADFLVDGPDSGDAKTATAVYAAVAIASVVPWTFLWRHLQRHPELLRPDCTTADAAKEARRPLVGLVAYALCLGAATLLPLVAVVLFILTAVYFAVTLDRRPRPGGVDAA